MKRERDRQSHKADNFYGPLRFKVRSAWRKPLTLIKPLYACLITNSFLFSQSQHQSPPSPLSLLLSLPVFLFNLCAFLARSARLDSLTFYLHALCLIASFATVALFHSFVCQGEGGCQEKWGGENRHFEIEHKVANPISLACYALCIHTACNGT